MFTLLKWKPSTQKHIFWKNLLLSHRFFSVLEICVFFLFQDKFSILQNCNDFLYDDITPKYVNNFLLNVFYLIKLCPNFDVLLKNLSDRLESIGHQHCTLGWISNLECLYFYFIKVPSWSNFHSDFELKRLKNSFFFGVSNLKL